MRAPARFLTLALAIAVGAGVPARAQDVETDEARAEADAARGIRQLTRDRILAIEDGGTLTLPPGRYRVPPGGLVVDRQITIEGSNPGRNRLTSGTILLPGDQAPVISIRERTGNVTLRDLIVDADGAAEHGIVLDSEAKPTYVTLERVSVWHAAGDGIALDADPGTAINLLVIRDCTANDNGGAGLAISGVAFPRIEGGYYAANEGGGVRIERCESARLRDVYFEANAPDSDGEAAPDTTVAQLLLDGGFNHVVDGCAFEDFARPGAGVGVIVDGAQGTHIDACLFITPRGGTGVVGVSYRDGSRDNWLGGCTWRSIATRSQTLGGSSVDVAPTQAIEK